MKNPGICFSGFQLGIVSLIERLNEIRCLMKLLSFSYGKRRGHSGFDYIFCSSGKAVTYRVDYADLAHLVECHLAKVEVASSSLVIRSINFVVGILTAIFIALQM